jgi:hypothetical protein
MNWQVLIDELKNVEGAQKDAFGLEETTEHWHRRLLWIKWRPRIERVACRRKGIDHSCWGNPGGPGAIRDAFNEYVGQLQLSEGKGFDEILIDLEELAQQRDKAQMLKKLEKYYPEALKT